jgi:hypothetical protein
MRVTPRRVTPAQVKELRRQLQQGASLRRAALRANMDRKSARKYRALGQFPEEARKPRTWRTWPDALAEVWPAVAEQLQQEPRLQAKTLWEWLQRTHPGTYPESMRRTFERRVRQWKASQGSAKEVFFTQEHPPGRLGASDFTSMNDVQVTVAGVAFPHLLYHFVLTCSNWEHVTLCVGEDFASLSAGLQNALWALGAVPERHRTDRMTLAVHHDGQAEQFTAKYRALLEHYGVQAEATNPASGHENGDVESSHRHFKEAVDQALLLRGSRDFTSRDVYWDLVQSVQARRNASRAAQVTVELAYLRPLPAQRLETQERERVRVRRGSTIRVKYNTYSVPARLIGAEVEARIGLEEIEVWYAQQLVQRMPRLRGQDKHHIDYRHIISWLVRKPGAFARYVYREDLYPTLTYRRAYDALVAQQPARADKEYVRLLYLASQEGEGCVEQAVAKLLDQRQPLSEQAVRTLLGEATSLSEAACVEVAPVDLRCYDVLLSENYEEGGAGGVSWSDHGREGSHEQGCVEGIAGLPAGVAPAGGPSPVRSGGSAGECRELELPGVFTGVTGAGMPATPPEADRAALEGIASAVGEELGGAGSEAIAAEGGAATARTVERGLCRSAGEPAPFRTSWIGKDACPVWDRSGAGPVGPALPVHDDGAAGAGTAGCQTRLDAEGVLETPEPLGGVDPGRPGLRAAEPRGNGGAVHAAGGALRTRQCMPDEQSAVLEVGTGLQGSDDDGSGHRSLGASQCDRGVERTQLPRGGGQTGQAGCRLTTESSPDSEFIRVGAWLRCGRPRFARLPPLRQAPTLVMIGSSCCRVILVAWSSRQWQRHWSWARSGER